MKRSTALAVTLLAVLGTSYVGNVGAAGGTSASSVYLKNGGNVETAVMQLDGQVGGLSNDVYGLTQTAKNHTKDIAALKQNDKVLEGAILHQNAVNSAQSGILTQHDTRITTLENAPKPTNGVDGKDGKDGAAGATGKAGAKGDKGDKGDSIVGAAGAAGAIGATGKAGTNGRNGRDVSPAVAKQVQANTNKLKQQDQQISDLRDDVKGIGNNAAAMSSLHFNGNRDSWAISTGSYNADGVAFAGGLQKSIGDNLATTLQASFDGQGNTMIGAGLHGDF